jgi:tRNA G18 (ribose-2'-O)-methylase SpoU
MLPKVKTLPDLSLNSPIHLEAIAKGKDHYFFTAYNVVDKFKNSTNEEIRSELRKTAHPFIVLCENVIGDLNLGNIMRSANAFNCEKFIYVGNKKIDKRPCVGVHNYMDIEFIRDIENLKEYKKEYNFVGFDIIPGAKPLSDYKWNFSKKNILLFGEEGCGLTPTIMDLCDDVVYIEQYGSVRSINVGSAASIIMHDFVKSFKK